MKQFSAPGNFRYHEKMSLQPFLHLLRILLNKYAKIWAKKLATDEKMSHNPDSKYGENVFCLSSNSTNFDAL
ncbi:hypothetical protein E2C01_007297 [Portunus trituberculatus]|uniref:Uncharacterized protein n=1 Tax=Portunus trituberculatus TaxID=210409 RepID=A0A5B7CYU1_PORTR|nr:hypothetical protein [Portunus trituberculatus]